MATTLPYSIAASSVCQVEPVLVCYLCAVASYSKWNLAATNLSSVQLGTPIFAAIINRIIDERLAVGKGPVGFINPVLYKNPSVLNDITNGTNPGCETDGFSTAPG